MRGVAVDVIWDAKINNTRRGSNDGGGGGVGERNMRATMYYDYNLIIYITTNLGRTHSWQIGR
jgi:hypothetical protein